VLVTEVRVGEPLADALFTMEFKEGVEVDDDTQNPPLIYKYKKDRTPEEWAAVKKEAEAKVKAPRTQPAKRPPEGLP
jgi:hypothetical protein